MEQTHKAFVNLSIYTDLPVVIFNLYEIILGLQITYQYII